MIRYQCYITDAVKMIAENTAKFASGVYPSKRYADVLFPEPVETRTSDEIITGIRDKLEKMGKEG